MNTKLALETVLTGPADRTFEGLMLADVDENGIKRRLKLVDPRGQHDLGLGRGDLGFVERPLETEIAGIVASTEGNPFQSPARRANLPGVGDAFRRLEDWKKIDRASLASGFTLKIGHHPVDGLEVCGILNLGENDAIEPRADDRLEIAEAELRIPTVHAHITAALAALLERLDDDGSRGLLLGHGHGILEIENRGVGAGQEDFLDFARVVSRREKIGSMRSHSRQC